MSKSELDTRSAIEQTNQRIALGLSAAIAVVALGGGAILWNRHGGESSTAPTAQSGGEPTASPTNLTAEQQRKKQLAEAACGGSAVESTLSGASSTVTTGAEDGAAPFTGVDDPKQPNIDTALLTTKTFYTVEVNGKRCSAAGEVFSAAYLPNVRDAQRKPIKPNTPVYIASSAFKSGNSTHRP